MEILSAFKNTRRTTRALLILFAVLAVSVYIIGLDNATGIILGWMATTCPMLLWVRRWRKIRYFLILLGATVIGAIFLSFVYMVIALPLAEWLGGIHATESTAWKVFHVVISDIILLFTPVGIVIGLVGSIVLDITRLIALYKGGGTTIFIIVRLLTPIGILFGITWAIWLGVLYLVALRRRFRRVGT